MAFSLIPDGVYPSVYQIDGKVLARRGITLLLADLDNTLAPYRATQPSQAIVDWKKELEAAGLVQREEYPQIPPKVEYSLSERGRSLIPILDAMCIWGEENRHRGKGA